jgi:hypothetical protein
VSVRLTIERRLRDGDDATAQTFREWRLQASDGFVTIAKNEHSDWLQVRVEDVPLLIADLQAITDGPEAGVADKAPPRAA